MDLKYIEEMQVSKEFREDMEKYNTVFPDFGNSTPISTFKQFRSSLFPPEKKNSSPIVLHTSEKKYKYF